MITQYILDENIINYVTIYDCAVLRQNFNSVSIYSYLPTLSAP